MNLNKKYFKLEDKALSNYNYFFELKRLICFKKAMMKSMKSIVKVLNRN